MAMVFLKQEKFSTAELHFTRATTIFRTNPDLICHLAVVGKFLANEIIHTGRFDEYLGST